MDYNELIICGDFNLPKIRWRYDMKLPGLLTPTYVEGVLEQDFVASKSQILEQPEDRNHLDLVFVANIDNFHCTLPIQEEFFYDISRFHIPILINCQIAQATESQSERNLGRINLKLTKKALKGINFELISEEDIFDELWNDNYVATAEICERSLTF